MNVVNMEYWCQEKKRERSYEQKKKTKYSYTQVRGNIWELMLGATQRKQRGIKEETDGSFKPWIEKLERGVAQVSKAFGGRGWKAGRGVWWVAPATALILSCSRVCAGVSSGSIQSPYKAHTKSIQQLWQQSRAWRGRCDQ